MARPPTAAERAAAAGMGSVARRGAANVRRQPTTNAPTRPAPDARPEDVWIDEGPVRAEASKAVARAAGSPRRTSRRRDESLPPDVERDLVIALGPTRAPKAVARLASAREAFEAERYPEARSLLGPLLRIAPDVAAVHELHGLTLYCLEQWRPASKALETYRELSGAIDQLPTLADCYRAMGKHERVEELWAELRDASPSPPVMAEGRIVMAGSMADRGRLAPAIELMEKVRTPASGRLHPYHLRQWYVLADLYDRAGEVPRARALFAKIRSIDPDFADVGDRLAGLGR